MGKINHRLPVIIGMNLSLILCLGCKSTKSSRIKGDLLPDEQNFGLMHVIHREKIRVCLLKIDRNEFGEVVSISNQSSNHQNTTPTQIAESDKPITNSDKVERKKYKFPLYSPQTIQERKNTILSALNQWTIHIAKFSGKPVIKNIEFFDEKDGCVLTLDGNRTIADLSIVLDPAVGIAPKHANGEGLAWVLTHMPGQLWMHININTSPLVILHEFGHTLGLSDAYSHISTTNSPATIMHYSDKLQNGELYPRDIQDIQFAYCRIHGKSNPELCAKLKAHDIGGNYPAITPQGEPIFKIKDAGIQIEEFMTSSYGNVYDPNKGNFRPGMIEEFHVRLVAIDPHVKKNFEGKIEVGDLLYKVNDQHISRAKEVYDGISYSKRGILTLTFNKLGTRDYANITFTMANAEAPSTSEGPKPPTVGIGTVIETIADSPLQIKNEFLGTAPAKSWLVIKEISSDSKYYWVTYRNATGWIKASDVILKVVQNIEYSK